MTPKRRRQLINAFSWIAEKSLPIYADNERMCLNLNRFETRNVITLFNLSCDKAKKVLLHYRPLGKLRYLAKNGRLLPLSCTVLEDQLIIEKILNAFDTLTIVDERMK